MVKENEVFHKRYRSLRDVRLQIPGKRNVFYCTKGVESVES